MNIKKYVIVLLIVLSTSVFGRTTLVQAELEKYDSYKRIVVIQGKPYKLNIDIKKSEYDIEFDANLEVKTKDLKVGETYYFNLNANPSISKNDFNEVIFIAKDEPGE